MTTCIVRAGWQMYRDHTISVVVPAFNEENKIEAMLKSIPDFVDKVYVIDDCSTDKTPKVVESVSTMLPKLSVIKLEKNSGVGSAIARGYEEAIRDDQDIVVVMAGDGQMHPDDLPALLDPVVEGRCDYSKGNRFLRGKLEIEKIPKVRLFGNLILSMLTKVAAGYWHVSDSQCGYTAINKDALNAVEWHKCYTRYGCPNDYLVKLNIANLRVADIPVSAVYGDDWSSSMSPRKVILPILFLLLRLFVHRMLHKYLFVNGHPLVLFYLLSFIGFVTTSILFGYILVVLLTEARIPQTATIVFSLSITMSLQFLLNAFSMDYRDNEWLCVHYRGRKWNV